MKAHNPTEVLNQRFNKLIVLSHAEIRGSGKNKAHFYLCKCDCGNEKIIRLTDFKTGRTKSCGCIQKARTAELGKARKLPNGTSPINILFSQYKKSAETRALQFKLNLIKFKELIAGNCYYCGSEPSAICRSRHYPETDFVMYNGVDRKDSSQDYSPENCVSCCGNCNYAKSDMSEKDFLDLVRKIYHNHFNETSVNRENQISSAS